MSTLPNPNMGRAQRPAQAKQQSREPAAALPSGAEVCPFVGACVCMPECVRVRVCVCGCTCACVC